MTGTNDNRPDFQRMLSDSERESWEVVLVYAIDRFGRNSTEIAVNKMRLKKNGKKLISATQRTSENLDGSINLDGILLENIYIGMAEYYSQELAQKIRRGLRESRKKGQFCGGNIPYGYYVKDKHLYVDEEKAETVKFIFEQYSYGEAVPRIIVKLNEKGILHCGKPFVPNAIYHILRNEKYIGITKINGEIFDIYPKIVSEEVFAKVRKRIEINKFGKRGVAEVYLLRNKIRCGYCGNTISADCGTSSKGKKVRYYKCRGRKKLKNGCTKSAVRKEVLEKFVLDHIYETLSNGAETEKIVSHLMKIQEARARECPEIKVLEKEKRQTETALNNVMAAIEQGIISNTTNKRLHELENKLEDIDKKILIEKSKTVYILPRNEIKDFYLKALKLEPLLLINYLIEEIMLYDDRIEIKYKSPLQSSPDDNRGFSFYEKVVFMPIVIQNKKEPIYKEMFLIKNI